MNDYGMNVTNALDNLMRIMSRYDYSPDVNAALQDAKVALGYDPMTKDQYYSVSLNIEFEAVSPEEAVRQYISLIESDRNDWVYTVSDEDGNTTEVDTYYWNRNK